MLKKITKKLLSYYGYEMVKKQDQKINKTKSIDERQISLNNLFEKYKEYLYFEDFSSDEIETIAYVSDYTMTGPLRLVTLIRAVKYIVENKLPGSFVECGVWKGGSMMAIARTLLSCGVTDRDLYLYDTFEGMSEPQEIDISFDNLKANELLDKTKEIKTEGNNIWCYSSLQEVKENLAKIGYNSSRIHFVKGKVEDTLPSTIPDSIALLRLDTDWYESTKHELDYLYPLLVKNGVFLIDDYGQWMGQKKAVDNYIVANKLSLFLNRIDFSSRVAIKV